MSASYGNLLSPYDELGRLMQRCWGTAIDWSATGEMLSGAGTMVGAAAVIYAAHKGADTFNQWKKQKLTERKILIAEQALILTYKLEPAIDHIRSPYVGGEENEVALRVLQEQGLVDEQTSENRLMLLRTAQASINRINSHRQLYSDLAESRPLVRAYFGKDCEGHLQVIADAVREVQSIAVVYPNLHGEDLKDQEARERNFVQMMKYQDVLWKASEIDDAGNILPDRITLAVSNAVQALEATFSPLLDEQAKLPL